jgi:hypothetical protein
VLFSDGGEITSSRPIQSQRRLSFPDHEQFAKKLVELLRRAPDIPSAAEACVRRCFFDDSGEVREGFYFTLYVSGYGCDEMAARKNWEVGLRLLGNALLQLSAVK